MVEFNIRETGSEILEILGKELRPKDHCRLTIDVLIPAHLRGDKTGLCSSIVSICKYLSNNVTTLRVDVEMLHSGQFEKSIKLNIEVKGSISDHTSEVPFVNLNQSDIARLLNNLPYSTSYVQSNLYVRFNFNMTFQLSIDEKPERNLFDRCMILLAEDSDVSALVFSAFLEEWGCTVTRVSDGNGALEEVRKKRFDLILIDIHMPGISGNETIRMIREFDDSVPIIAVAASSMKTESAKAREAGADNIIIKPVSGNELQKLLKMYLRIYDT